MNEEVQKCFYCSNNAIAICDSCSPTSATGLTPEKPLCEDCIVNGIGINIVRFLIPENEAEKLIEKAIERKKQHDRKYKVSRGEIQPWKPQELQKMNK